MILAVNTSTIQFSIALLKENGTVLAEYLTSPGSRNFGSLMPSIHYLIKNSKSNIEDIKAFVVTTGPGSFTGLRVGLSTAKGMAHGLQIPVIGVSSLEAMANLLTCTAYPVCPIIDSRKGEVFTALFNFCDNHKIVRIKEDICLKFEDLSSFIEETTLFLGNDYNRQEHVIREALGHKALLAPAHLWNLKASAVGTLGLKRFHSHSFDDLQSLVPSYLRPPDISPNPITK